MTTKITSPRVIKGLTCPEHLKQIYYPIQPDIHLYLSVGRGGKKSFSFRVRQKGKTESGKHTGTTRTLDLGCEFKDALDDTTCRLIIQRAVELASELTAKVSRGEDPFMAAKLVADDPTLQELFDHYKKGHLEKGAKRVDDAVNDFRRWFGHVAKRKASTFTWADANKLHEQMSTKISKKTKKPATYSANRAVQLGRAFYNFGLKTKMIKGDNPFAGVSLNKETPRERFLSDDEAATLLNTVIDVPPLHCRKRSLYDLIFLGMSLGARKANLLTMRFDELDERDWVWTIPAAKMKGEKPMAIKLSSADIAVIEDRKKILKDAGIITPWVFPSDKSQAGHIVDPGKGWDALRDELGMPDLTLHDLRRSLASAMINSGTDASIVQRALTHADPRTTAKHYIRTTQQAELEARERVYRSRLEGAGRVKPAVKVLQLKKKRTKN